jgi:hypothetical protein
MTETPAAYAGIRALQAGYEEGQAYKALALALLTKPARQTLQRMAAAAPDRFCWPYLYSADWHVMERTGLVVGPSIAASLTPFGAQVAAALGEGE